MPIPQPQSYPPGTDVSKERALEGLFLASPVPMAFVDVRSRRITRANGALERLLGCEANELSGRALRDVDTSAGGDVDEHLLLALACGDSNPRRCLWRTWQGAPIPVDIQATRLHGDRGTLLVLYVHDARHDREVEADRVQTQSQLWMAQKHEAVGRLAVGFARDFDDIISTVVHLAEGLGAHPGGGGGSDPAAQRSGILEAAGRARVLLRELLAFTGQQVLERRILSLNEVVSGADQPMREALPADVGLLVRLCPTPAMVNVDPEQIRRALQHLVENARDAMPEGGYVVVATEEVELDDDFARTHPSVRPGPHVLLSVTDTGVGMDEATRARVFEPFFSTRREGGGTGLGLATVYGIVKQNGGSIWVASQPEQGTTFRVYLPRVLETA